MIRVVLIGYGNLGKQLAKALNGNDQIELVQVLSSQDPDPDLNLAEGWIHQAEQLTDATVYLLAIGDDHIQAFSQQLPKLKGLVAHCSGSTTIRALADHNRRGVFYPLQTFSPNSDPDWTQIPICLEAEQPEDLGLLKTMAAALTPKVYEVTSDQRLHLHLAAVLVNNFGNHLAKMAQDQLQEAGLDYELLLPLMQETLDKLKRMPPAEAQTGPAKRADSKTMEQHLKLLDGDEKELYSIFSRLIQKK